jgi:MFS family permease
MTHLRLRGRPRTELGFTPRERQVVGGLTALLTLRMLGFYLVLPILTPYVRDLAGSTPILVGLSVGIYGLTQTVFQVPFGTWSDRWGRKPVLTLGLLLFALGSVLCAVAHTAAVMVAGRLVQGMGAIASVLVAMLADLTRDKVRTRAMAMVGIAIGGSFAVGLLLGPSASDYFGVPELFWFTAALTLIAVVWLWWKIPDPPRIKHHDELEYSKDHLVEVVRNHQLLRLDAGTFNLHMSLTAIFVTVPFMLREVISPAHQWRLFLPLLAVGLCVMLLGPRLGRRPGQSKRVALAGMSILAAALAVLALTVPTTVREPRMGTTALVVGLFLFIIAFALLEPLFPALLTRRCQQANRGTAAGIFNMSQFSGAFVGGLVSGLFLERNVEALFWILTATSALWVVLAMRLEDPEHLSVLRLIADGSNREIRRELARRLLRIRGVEDVAWEAGRRRVLVRYAPNRVETERLRREADAVLPARSG